jgi:Cu(I)/Ag(I) efflux system periplasmic protein CusF
MKHTTLLYMTTLVFSAATPVAAQTTDHGAHHPTGAQATKTTGQELTDGEVRKVDMETKKITIRHGPIQNLGMPPMTMVFQTSDPALLGKVKSGDKVRFTAEKTGGAFVVTHIEPVN